MGKEKVKNILTKAEKYVRSGKTDSAINEYLKIIKKFPDNLTIRKILGDLYYKCGDRTEAIRHFKWIAEYFLREGDVNKATAMYKRITRINPDYEDAYFKLSELYSRQGLSVEAKQIYLDLADKFKRQKKIKKSLDMYQRVLKYDPSNIDMRLVLAKNYLNEGHEEQAVQEYRTAVSQLIEKKQYDKASQILTTLREKITHRETRTHINQQIIHLLRKQDKNKECIRFIEGEIKTGSIKGDVTVFKHLGELYLKDGRIEDAERIFIQVAKVDPDESENLMDLGKVYLERGEFKKTLEVFQPLIVNYEKASKIEEAASLLRLIIAYNNSFLPALLRLADLYKKSGKKNNLIAIYESLLRVYEKEGMKKDCRDTLEKLIEMSDDPYVYEEKLAELSGEEKKEVEKQVLAEEEERKNEFIHFNLRMADEAINESDFSKALDILVKAKQAYPDNIDVRKRIYDIHEKNNDQENKLREGKVLLDLYQRSGDQEQYEDLLNQLSLLDPDDEKLVDLQKNESTHIDINFDTEDLEVDLSHKKEESAGSRDEELLLLSNEVKEDDPGSSGQDGIELEVDSSYTDEKKTKDPEKELEITSTDKDSDLLPERADSRFDIEVNFDYLDDHKIKLDEEKIKEASKSDLKVDLSDSKRIDKEEINRRVDEAIFGSREGGSADPRKDIISDIRREVAGDEPENLKLPEEDEWAAQAGSGSGSVAGGESEGQDINIEVEPEGVEEKGAGKKAVIDPEEAEVDKFFDELEVNEKLLIGFEEDSGKKEGESSFQEVGADIFEMEDSSDEILQEEVNFFDEEQFYSLSNNAREEIASIRDWIKELQKQKTSTVEKNMMEIFEEFKKGVNEKIGNEDFDTRYNLGIAYKEMGLIDEAIHEFLISSKSEEKFFDSAGLLGICFREKGMHSEALTWFKKALNYGGRKKDEYLSIKYEMLHIYLAGNDRTAAVELARDIIKQNPDFRDVSKILDRIQR